MTDKTKSQTYDFLSKNKTIEDILNQPNITFKEKSRHGGKTLKLIEDNNTNKSINDELSENEIFYDALDNIDTEKISPSQILTKEIGTQTETTEEKSNINLKKYSYNTITTYDEKQSKKTGINKIYEEILPIEDKIIFITTFVRIDNSITEEIVCFQQLTNGDIKIFKQNKLYENINEYKKDITLINDILTNKNKVSFKMIPIKEFLSEQEKLSNWKISKSEWIIFISLSLLSITLLAIPVAVPALIPIVSTILWEKTLVSIVGIGIAWIVNKGIWTIATEKTKKVEVWIKQNFYSLIRKIPFVNKRNLGKTKEELEIKKNVEKTIENLTSDKLETILETQFKILKQELDNRKDMKPDKLISNNKANDNSNIIIEKSNIKSENNQNFDSSIRNTANQFSETSTNSNHNWNKVKCLFK